MVCVFTPCTRETLYFVKSWKHMNEKWRENQLEIQKELFIDKSTNFRKVTRQWTA